MNSRMNLTAQVLLVICVLLACEVGLLGWLGSLLKNAEAQIDHERAVLRTIDHLERLSMLREKATSGLLLQQMFLKDDPNSRRFRETFGRYLEEIPAEMRTVVDLVQDDAEVSANAKNLQRLLLEGVQEMRLERDLYVTKQNDDFHVMKLNRMANSASQLTQVILDHYRNLEQDASRYEGESRANLQKALGTVLVFNIVLALCLATLFIRGIIRRLRIVTENSQKLALGVPLNAPMTGGDEIANLDHVFHQMADALEESAHKERAIVENAVDIICSIDRRMRFAAVNPASQSVLGISPDDLIGKNILTLVAPTHIDGTRERFESIMRDETKSEFETVLITKSGAQIDVACSARWSQQERAIFSVIRDISQAKEVARLKQEFAAMVSHDLRTPLSSVHGTLELLLADVYDSRDEKGKNRLRKALGSLDRLLSLVNDLLDLEKLDAGKMVMDIKPTSVPELIKKAIDAVAGFAESHNVQVSGEAAEIIVMADEDRVIQVMVNLLSNAIKFSPPGTSVKISAGLISENGDDGAHSGDLKGAGVHGYCEIQISDRGRGIPADQLPFLFERFRQTEKGDGKRGVGTGLGLAICKAIVEGHEGTIGASSELGKGTTVWLRLPIAT